MDLPLSGIRILDLSRLVPGAYASQMMADFGADVIKIEEPGSGDYSRSMQPSGPGGMGLYFLALNRNKRSVTLNLKSEQGRTIFLRMVSKVDVVLESFRPGVLERLGLGYDQLKEQNRGIIYCAISGYGQDGPYQLRAGHDLNYAGYAGLVHSNRGAHDDPVMPPTQFGDLAGGGQMAMIGILTALVGRAQTGEGRRIDASMTEGILSLFSLSATTYLNTGKVPRPGHSTLDGGLPCYNIYETQDGKHIILAALELKFWQAFCRRIGHLDLLPFHMPVGSGESNEAKEMLKAIFKARTRDEWLAELADIDACVGPVYDIGEALEDTHAQARHVSVSGNIDGEPFHSLSSFPRISDVKIEQRYAPPRLSEHTEEILLDVGYSSAEIARFRVEGII